METWCASTASQLVMRACSHQPLLLSVPSPTPRGHASGDVQSCLFICSQNLVHVLPGLQAGPDRGHVAVLAAQYNGSVTSLFPILTKCASIFASIDRTPSALHTASLYALFTCAKLSVSVTSSFGSISAANTSGSFTASASRMEIPPRRKYVTVSDSYSTLFLFCATTARSPAAGVVTGFTEVAGPAAASFARVSCSWSPEGDPGRA